jgi:AraC-like DNA-binding protein
MLDLRTNWNAKSDYLAARATDNTMAEITVPARKFMRLLDYMERIGIDAPYVNRELHNSLPRTIKGPVYFDAGENTCIFDHALLDRRIVHPPESLSDFLKNSVYHVIAMGRVATRSSAAIKSLISIDLLSGLPSFADMAATLYMSESSLRRRLQAEETCYQAIKDEVRCQVAIDKLLLENARVADLAELLGYTEPSSFVRSFKSWTGFTPKTYKDRVQALGRT